MGKSVQFSGAIANSPKIKVSQKSISTDNEILSASDLPSFTRKNYVKKHIPRNQSSAFAVVSKTTPNSNSASASGTGEGLSLIGSKGNASSEGSGYANNISQPFSEAGVNTNPIQKAPTDDPMTPSDPGGEDPIGPPLPVGDGFLVLVVMAALYSFYICVKKF